MTDKAPEEAVNPLAEADMRQLAEELDIPTEVEGDDATPEDIRL